ncbi:MAG: 4-(cytidine 5'-diphospho)-2-C-methyl-D-erythritol kinase [Oscillospiraceae bacterium]|jgi:4-diphosphocytidyl-2-C-methyl-D-erythritol kinase|nr:4-(cytidine 5'-diphospho)-2-C-methyl-D-erythritol kinase [Oscillospiraceae bacterium]
MLTEPAYAKLNLSLDVTGHRKDGYHLLSMANVCVSLQDTLEFEHAPDVLQVSCIAEKELPPVPDGKDNLVYRAAETFFESTGEPDHNVRITVHKRIPSEAGLGGGSADAAAALRGLCRFYDYAVSIKALCRMAETIGADVPFCVQGGTALAEGIGEELTPLPPVPDCWFVVCKPEVGVSTADAYRRLDEDTLAQQKFTPAVVEALRQGSLSLLGGALGNAFEAVISLPEVRDIKCRLLQDGALGACMTGSGSAVFGIFDAMQKAKTACMNLHRDYPYTFQCVPQRSCFPQEVQ